MNQSMFKLLKENKNQALFNTIIIIGVFLIAGHYGIDFFSLFFTYAFMLGWTNILNSVR